MIAPLRTVLVKRPDEAFAVNDPAAWHYTARPDLALAQQEHDALAALLRQSGAEVIYHDEHQPEHADAIFAFDPALVTDHGAIILSMGKPQRRGEEAVMARRFETLGMPIHYTLHNEARAEGGDLLWLKPRYASGGTGLSHQYRGIAATPRGARADRGLRITGGTALLHGTRGLPAPALVDQYR